MGALKLSEAADDFNDNFSGAVKRAAAGVELRTSKMMRQDLEYNFGKNGTYVMDLLVEYGFAGNVDIDYQNCERINGFDLKEQTALLEAVFNACKDIAKLMSDERMREHEEAFKNTIREIVIANTLGIIKRDIYGNIASFASDVLLQQAREFVEKKAQGKAKEEAVNDNKQEETGSKDSEDKKKEGKKEKKKYPPKAPRSNPEFTSSPPKPKEQPAKPVDPEVQNKVKEAYKGGASEIDKSNLPPAEKNRAKFQLHEAMNEFSSLSTADQQKVLQDIQNKANPSVMEKIIDTAGEVFDKINKIEFVSSAQAAGFAAPLVVGEAIALCVANSACLRALTATATYLGYNGYKEYKTWEDDGILEKSWNKEQKQQKVNTEIAGKGTSAGGPDWEPDDHKNYKEWKVENYDKSMIHDKHGKFMRDPKALSENGRRIWWVKDNANHGGSTWKAYEEIAEGLTRYKDVDKFGNYMHGKHQSKVADFISWKELRGIHIKR